MVWTPIASTIEVNDAGEIAARLKERKRARTKLTSAYRKMRTYNTNMAADGDGA
ncbi:hypothetical protein [Bradyrhizobium brasilense]|uniref:hypothetical protein n=1 Tax=Bradyrhizobium brasilense TaxID=1419277 RepID=UPI001300EB75|nr:hypothetical protein [Bradyrhizobium brasilense]